MNCILKMPVRIYLEFLRRCELTSREYAVLKMRRTANDGVLARRAAARRRYFGAHAFLFEIFKLLGHPDRRERHVSHGGENINFG